MTEAQQSLPAPNTNVNTPAKKSSSGNIILLILIIVLAAMSVSAGIYFWQSLKQQATLISHLNEQKQNQAKRLSELERNANSKINQLEMYVQATSEKLTSVDRQALFNTQQLTELGASSRADWLLAETEYLLHLANQKLNLEKDFAGAEAILAAADKVIAELNDPGLLPIRQAIAKESFDLQQVQRVDHQGIYLKLSTLIAAIEDLDNEAVLKTRNLPPLSENAEKRETNEESAAYALWQAIWKDLKNVVVIRRLDEPVAPLLAPEQSYYLKQNLRLMLEQASVALLERNQVIFGNSIEKAHTWLSNYFELSNAQVNSLKELIEELKSVSIEFEVPDISQSLRLTKKKVEMMYRNHSLGKLNSVNDEKQAQEEK